MVRRGNYRAHFWQRIGFYSEDELISAPARSAPMWVQAVSVGEMLVALKFIDAVRRRQPAQRIILSTTTTTGFRLAHERVSKDVEVIYTPIDLMSVVRRTFDRFHPNTLIIVDGGLWPNQLLEAHRRGIPVTLVNARLSPRSERRYLRFSCLTCGMFRLLDRVCVPEDADVARWSQLGVNPAKIAVTGSIKYDDAGWDVLESETAASKIDSACSVLGMAGVAEGAPILLAGSTHPGEELLIAEVFARLRVQFPKLLLLLAPRHVERSPEILRELAALKLRIVSRTETLGPFTSNTTPDIFLLDTTGELRAWYAAATIVVIGKSLCATGGQSPAEAILAGKPVMFGPHMENFAQLADALVESGAAIRVQGAVDLEARAAVLLQDHATRVGMAERARTMLASHRGAADRTAALLLP